MVRTLALVLVLLDPALRYCSNAYLEVPYFDFFNDIKETCIFSKVAYALKIPVTIPKLFSSVLS